MSAHHLALTISHSPLLATSPLASAGSDNDLLSTLLNKCTLEDLHTRSSSSRNEYIPPNTQPTSDSLIPSLASRLNMNITLGKPPPALASPPHTTIISILNILDAFDQYVACETARIKCNIQDVHDNLEAYKTERQTRLCQVQQRQEREKRDTKGIDGDFWLGV